MIHILNAVLRKVGRVVDSWQRTFRGGCAGCGSRNARLTFRLCPGCAADHKAATAEAQQTIPGQPKLF